MNYTINKNNVVFELPLSDYLGTGSRYNYQTKQHEGKLIETLQDYEENLFYNFESHYSYITLDELSSYYDYSQADQYLISKGYTQDEIDLHRDELNQDIRHSLAEAKDSSHQAEWIQSFRNATQRQIELDLDEALDKVNYKLLDFINSKDFDFEQDNVKISIPLTEIKKALSPEDRKDADFIDLFYDQYLDYSRKPIDTEYIDRYGQLGSFDDWFECFKVYNEIEDIIDNYRKDEQDKINNIERASLELKPQLDAITNYITSYITKEPASSKIKRQIQALQSIIKNS